MFPVTRQHKLGQYINVHVSNLNPTLLQYSIISFSTEKDTFPRDGCHLGSHQLSDFLAEQFLLILQLLFFKIIFFFKDHPKEKQIEKLLV